MPGYNLFKKDFCTTILSAKMSFSKLKNANFRDFPSIYTRQNIPDESIIR